MKQLDLHNRELSDAVLEIIQVVKECVLQEENVLEIIHGYTHGMVIKIYLNSPKFKAVLKREGVLLDKMYSTKGSTTYKITCLMKIPENHHQSEESKSIIDDICRICGNANARCSCKYCVLCGKRIEDGKCDCQDPAPKKYSDGDNNSKE
jgi:hypothetical protein